MKKWILDHTDIVCPICDARYSDEIVLMHGPIKHCPNCGLLLSMNALDENKSSIKIRKFDHRTTWEDVQNMTIEEAIDVLSFDANSDDKDWSARPHKARAAQITISVLKYVLKENK